MRPSTPVPDAAITLIARLWRYAAFPLTRPQQNVIFDPPLNEEELAVLNDAIESSYPVADTTKASTE